MTESVQLNEIITGELTVSTSLANPAVVESFSQIADIDLSELNDNAVLVYKTETNKWTSTTTLQGQSLEGGEF